MCFNYQLPLQLQYECAYYDPLTFTWDTTCITKFDYTLEDAGMLCLCTHNSSFAVLVVSGGNLYIVHVIYDNSYHVLRVYNYIEVSMYK